MIELGWLWLQELGIMVFGGRMRIRYEEEYKVMIKYH